jgi:SAM-dependent methyltransferase
VKAQPSIEQAADWESLWQGLDDDAAEVASELAGLRWHTQVQLVERRFGAVAGLEVIEIGAGRATNALLYAMHGARATVLDTSPTALERSRQRFADRGLEVETVQADAFDLPAELRDRFDVAMSFGLCEHFLGARRLGIVAAHLQLLKPGALAIVNVPNRYSPFYRAWMALAKRRGSWTLGTEVPFSASELSDLAKLSGGVPLTAIHVGGLGTLVNHGLNPVLKRLARTPLPIPQTRLPGLDRLAYDLLLPIVRPA